MSESSQNFQDEVMPVALEDRSLSGFSTFAIWFAGNLVVTTVFTGMLFIPSLSVMSAVQLIFIGSIIGVIPLTLMAIIGTKTGLTTMVLSRGTFGIKGSMLPSTINALILIVWSWAQAALGGLALNYISARYIGFDNFYVYTIITEALVVFIALYAIKGISLYEKVAMVLILIVFGSVILKAVSTFGAAGISSIRSTEAPDYTAIVVFDIVVSTALSWTPLSADYNRNCKSVKGSAFGAMFGYSLGTTLSMGTGALIIGMMILAGTDMANYDPSNPSLAFDSIGFGVIGSIVIFVSVLAANVMCVYSSTMSVLNMFPKFSFKKTAMVIGVICTVGACFSGILDAFINFVYLIGVLFMPMFAIIIADFYVIQKRHYNIEGIIYPEKDNSYHYKNGVNIPAIVVYFISAAIAYYCSQVDIAIGATIPCFIIAFVLYIAAAKIFNKNRV